MFKLKRKFYFSYTKSFIDFGRELSQFLKFSALEVLVSDRSVSFIEKKFNLISIFGLIFHLNTIMSPLLH